MSKHLIHLLTIIIIIICSHLIPSDAACQDFHQYVCENNSEEMIQQLDHEFHKKLLSYLKGETLLDQIIKDTIESLTKCQTFYDKILIYFEACSNEDKSLIEYFEVIRPLLNTTNFDYWSLLGKIQSYGLTNVIVKHDITRHKDNTLTLTLAPATFKEALLLPHTDELRELLLHFGFSNVELIIQDLYKMETNWKKLSLEYEKHNKLNEFINIKFKDLNLLYPQLKLQNYFIYLMAKDLDNLVLITLRNPKYFQYLNDKIWSSEELKTLPLYLSIKFLIYLMDDKTTDFNDRDCVKDLWNNFYLGVNFIYYLRYFRWEVNEFNLALSNMLNKIQTIMLSHFQENYLNLSVKQINYLKEKLFEIKINVGNLFPINDIKAIQTFYQDLPRLNKTNYYQNHLFLLEHKFRQTLRYAQHERHYLSKFNPNIPFYDSQLNMIILPFGCLQLPLYHYRQTPLQQLSLFGFVLAHELTHAFDNKVLSMHHNDIAWSITNHTNFMNSLKCLNEKLPTNFINERIADLVAVRIVYQTYKEYYARDTINWKKDFFINLGKFFCGKYVTPNPQHDADSIRLQQIVRNFEPFAEAFECKMGDNMHPEKKCRLY